MQNQSFWRRTWLSAMLVLLAATACGLASPQDLIPPQLPKEQQANLLRFLQQHEKPAQFIPPNAKFVGTQPGNAEAKNEGTAAKPIKQYTAQITPHRPVPGQDDVKRVDVYYYRPNPERGKPGITVRYTVDLTTGNQVGPTEVLLNHLTPVSREELAEAVALAREKSATVQELYKDREEKAVHWEYLQLVINRPHEPHQPGDHVVRLVFMTPATNDNVPPTPVRVLVNLTKGIVVPDNR